MRRRFAGFGGLALSGVVRPFPEITVLRVISSGPDPKKWPDSVQREQAHPTSGMDRILVGVIALFGDVIRNVVDGNDPVGEDQYDKDQNDECEPAEKVHGS